MLGNRPKARALGKKREKRSCEDDIPLEAKPEIKHQDDLVCELQKRLLCDEHSAPGLRTFCWVEPATVDSKGGHREILHDELTLWAKHIVSKKKNMNTTNEDSLMF